MSPALPTLLALMLAAFACGSDAYAEERPRLLLPPEVASQRTLQLSPGRGIFPGYTRPRTVKPYVAGDVIMKNGVPIGIRAADGKTYPVGSFDDGRGGPPPTILAPAIISKD